MKNKKTCYCYTCGRKFHYLDKCGKLAFAGILMANDTEGFVCFERECPYEQTRAEIGIWNEYMTYERTLKQD